MKTYVNFTRRLLGFAGLASLLALQPPSTLLCSSSDPSRSLECLRAGRAKTPPHGANIPKEKAEAFFGELPLSFEANHGQADSQVKFLSRGSNYNVYLTAKEAVMEFRPTPDGSSQNSSRRLVNASMQTSVVRMKPLGANAGARPVAVDEMSRKTNCFIGGDPSRWRANIPSYARVKYEDIYPGVDMVFYGKQRQFEYDFVVAPRADFKLIRIEFEGARRIRITSSGELVVETPAGEIRHRRPVAYQHSGNGRRVIPARYVIKNRTVGFEVARYDRSKQLTIDPVVSYSTYLGGA